MCTSRLTNGDVAIRIAVKILVPGACIQRVRFIDNAITIIIVAIAILWRTRVSRWVGIVAIAVVEDVATGFGTSTQDKGLVSIGVGISIFEPRVRVNRRTFVRNTVAVVVNAIANLTDTGVYVGIKVVAVIPTQIDINKAIVVLVPVHHFKHNRITISSAQGIDHNHGQRVPTEFQIQQIKLRGAIRVGL